MRIAIDASNIQVGGGVTHLVELLRAADPQAHGIERIIVWARNATLERIEDRPWLDKRTDPALERGILKRTIWQRFHLGRLAAEAGADLMFVPGGSIVSQSKPAVTMSRNMLPFEWRELVRFGISGTALKMLILRLTQSISFKTADGTIFLTRYAHDAVLKITGPLAGAVATIPHGIDDRFRRAPRPQRTIKQASTDHPLRIIYVSIVDVYKHQWIVADAVARLYREGLPVRLDLYGPARDSVLPRLKDTMARVDPNGAFISYHGSVDYKTVDARYAESDICVFASSCENMPNILVEGMAAALPIACSNRGPMPEILGDAGLYFDPESPASIADTLRRYVVNADLRSEKAAAARMAAERFSWTRCTKETLDFLVGIIRRDRPAVTSNP